MSHHVLDDLFQVIAERAESYKAGDVDSASRTHKMLEAGRAKISQKIGEEAVEVVIEAISGKKKDLVDESADLLFFLVLLWAERGIVPEKVWAELRARLELPESEERTRRKKEV